MVRLETTTTNRNITKKQTLIKAAIAALMLFMIIGGLGREISKEVVLSGGWLDRA